MNRICRIKNLVNLDNPEILPVKHLLGISQP
jgi:hypothetical protein